MWYDAGKTQWQELLARLRAAVAYSWSGASQRASDMAARVSGVPTKKERWAEACRVGEWYQHDGGPRPIPGFWMVELPAGTYHSSNGRGTLGPFKASSFEWESRKIRHLRDEIKHYKVVSK